MAAKYITLALLVATLVSGYLGYRRSRFKGDIFSLEVIGDEATLKMNGQQLGEPVTVVRDEEGRGQYLSPWGRGDLPDGRTWILVYDVDRQGFYFEIQEPRKGR